MTPEPPFNADRRSFVKKSLATSVSISFAGLIRAHGEEGGGSTTAPETTMVFTTELETMFTTYQETTMVYTTGPQTTMVTTIATEPQTTAQIVEVIKQDPQGTGNQSSGVIIAGKILVKDGNNTKYECGLTWSVDLAVFIDVQPQGKHVQRDCLSCTVKGTGAASNPKVKLVLGLPTEEDTKVPMKDFQTNFLDVNFEKLGVLHTRGVDASGVETLEQNSTTKVAKVKTSLDSPLGQPSVPSPGQDIVSLIAGTITPDNRTDASEKLVTWDVTFKAPWTASAATKTALENEVKKRWPSSYAVVVTLTGVPDIAVQCKQIVKAEFISSADPGAGCTCKP